MKDVPKYAVVTAVLFFLITGAGGGAWYWTSGYYAAKIEEQQGLQNQIKQISGSGIYPSPANLKQVEENVAAAGQALEPLTPVLEKTSALLDPVRGKAEEGKAPPGLSPDAWKSLMTGTRTELQRLAKDRGVKLPEEYYFGFKDYQLSQPPTAHTLQLGVQLLAIKEICSILFNAGIVEFKGVKRVKVEAAGASAPGGAATDEILPGSTVVSKDKLYRVYPFEIDFVSSPEVLEKAVAALAASPYFLILRDVVVENPKISLARKSEVIGSAANPTFEGIGGTAASAPKLLVTVSGTEDILVRMRVSLVEWAAPDLKFLAEEAKPAGNAPGNQPPRRRP